MIWIVKLSAHARRDIEYALATTFEKFGQKKHDQYVELIRTAIEEIAGDPYRTQSRSRPELGPAARTFHIGKRGRRARHQFVYRIVGTDTVEIGRLLYDGMDISRHLPDGFGDP
jgi:toxin ParE1/3/4